MATARLMLTNRTGKDELGDRIGSMRYFEHQKGPVNKFSNWAELTRKQFVDRLVEIAGAFPVVPEDQNQDQKHISLFIHGYNNTWEGSVKRYEQIRTDMFEAHDLG